MDFFPHGVGGWILRHADESLRHSQRSRASLRAVPRPTRRRLSTHLRAAVNSPEPIDLEESKCIVLIGSHIGENVFTSQVTNFITGLQRGAKLIVVDPRFSTAASKADYWLPIKPGTDIALLLAWMNVLISENLYRQGLPRSIRHGAEGARSSRERIHAGVGGTDHRDFRRHRFAKPLT